MSQNDERIYSQHLLVLAAGFLVGIIVAAAFVAIPFDFSREIEQAGELGVISRTVLDAYPKKHDMVNYAAVLGFPVLFGVGGWFLWAKGERLKRIRAIFAASHLAQEPDGGWKLPLTVVAVFYLVVSFACFRTAAYGNLASLLPWLFVGEEGANLAWVQSILNGGVYGRDINCLYGPMLIYPLAWFMKVFGVKVSMLRLYTYCLNLAAYGIIIAFLYKSLRSKTTFVASALVYLCIFSPLALLFPNASYLRVVLGILPILLVYQYLKKPGKLLLVATGAVLGQSVLFSQEVGVCSILAVLSVFVVARVPEKGYRDLIRESGIIFLGGVVSVAPMVGYFIAQGVLGDVVHNLLDFPRLLELGFMALPFPDILAFLSHPLAEGTPIFYSIIFIYILSALYLVPLLILGHRDRKTLLRVAVLVFGIVLFKSALGRSDEFHGTFVLPPAVLLVFLFIDDALAGLQESLRLEKITRSVVVLLSLAVLVVVTLCNNNCRIWIRMAPQLKSVQQQWVTRSSGRTARGIPRLDVATSLAQADDMEGIGNFLEKNTKRGENVYFFPTDGAYYFIFDRKNPTKFNHAIHAATTEQRLELIASLEEEKPRFVVYNRGATGIDDIKAVDFDPEVDSYIKSKYRPVGQQKGYLFLELVEGATRRGL